MGCDCPGCCLAALSPLAPPAPPAPPPPPPPPLPPPPSSPSPLLPPLAPGRLAASSMTELRDIVEGLNSNHPATPPFPAAPPSAPPGLPLPQTPPPTPPSQPPPGQPPPPPPEIPPSPPIPPPPPSPPAPPGVPSDSRVVALSGRYLLGGSPLLVRGVGLTLEGVGSEGATIDAEGMSRAIEVTDGASLTLRNIHVVNGNATTTGGGLLVHGAGSSLLMDQADVRDSVSFGAFPEGGGAPGTFRTAHAASDLTADAHCSRLGPHTGPMALSGWPQARDPPPPPHSMHPHIHATALRAQVGSPCGRAQRPCWRAVRSRTVPLKGAVVGFMPVSRLAARTPDRQIRARPLYSCHLATFILTGGHANVTLRGGSRVERCRAFYGGAVGVFEGSSSKILDGSVLSECHGTSWGGGAMILCYNVPCHAEFVQSSILNCSAQNAGGFYSNAAPLLAVNSVRCATARTHCIVPISGLQTPMGLRFRPAPCASADC